MFCSQFVHASHELLGHVGITMDLIHDNEMGIDAGLLVVGDQLLHPVMQFSHKHTDENNLTVGKFTRDNVIPKIENSTIWVRNNVIDKTYELIPKMVRLLKKHKNLKIVFMGAHLSLRTKALIGTRLKKNVQNTNDTNAIQKGTWTQKHKTVLCFVFHQNTQKKMDLYKT